MSDDETRKLAIEMFEGGWVCVDWPATSAPQLCSNEPKYLLNLILITTETTPRGGTVGGAFEQRAGTLLIVVTAKGERAKLNETKLQALEGGL